MKAAVTFVLLFPLLLGFSCAHKQSEVKEQLLEKPNIIYILADDLGYGDLGCYGQTLFTTPNIDRLAAEGMLFTQHYSGSTVCAPSRSALMTGLHTGHTYIRGNREMEPEGQHPLADSIVTLAELLKESGYKTGVFGKWGLGAPKSEGDPNKQGFDQFYGYNCQRLAHHYYPRHLWNNQDKIEIQENAGFAKGVYAPDRIHKASLEFIEQNKGHPFFLFVTSPLPHAELIAPDSVMAKYRNKYLPEKKYEGTDSGDAYRLGPYESQEESHAAFVAMIDVLDQQVGEVIDMVRSVGLEEKTLIIFTSDNGPHKEGGADPDYFDSNGPLKGYKRDLYEGGIRVPMIARYPGKIKPGSKSDHVSAFWDVVPTLMDLVDNTDYENGDGISFLPSLLGRDNQDSHKYLYWEFHERGGRIAIRKDKWKAIKYDYLKSPEKPFQLYDLSQDIGEENDIARNNPDLLEEMETILGQARTPSKIFSFTSAGYLQKK